MSIEKEVFPFMAADGQLHIMDLGGFWADVGQPKDFLAGTAQYLKYLSETPEVEATAHSRLAVAEKFKSKNIELIGNAIIDSTATIGKDCKIGPNVVVGARVKVGDGVRLSDCVLMPDSLVKDVKSKKKESSGVR